jgi:ABC-type multidrug transport system fused ATPase/permease subunit
MGDANKSEYARAQQDAGDKRSYKPQAPPLIEDPSVQGPLRVPIAQSCRSQEELEALEQDYNWFRYSTCAAPMLISIAVMLALLLVFSLCQTAGYNSSTDWWNQDGTPRTLMLQPHYEDDEEGGIMGWVRTLRIIGTCLMFSGLTSLLFFYFKKTTIVFAFFGIFCVFCASVVHAVTFSWSVNHITEAHWCPVGHYDLPDLRARFGGDAMEARLAAGNDALERHGQTPQFLYTTWEQCDDRSTPALWANIVDLVFFVVGLVLVIILVRCLVVTKTGFFQLRTGWEAQHYAHQKITDEGLHRTWTQLSLITIFALLACVVAEVVLLTKLHNNRTTFVLHGPIGHTDVNSHIARVEGANILVHDEGKFDQRFLPTGKPLAGQEVLETSGWPVGNSRVRILATLSGIVIIFLNLFPFTSSVIATIFAILLFVLMCTIWVAFAFDISQVNLATDIPCPPRTECNHTAFLLTITIDFLVGTLLLVYLTNEFFLRMFCQCKYCSRKFTVLEIGKHQRDLCSRRPVTCEFTHKEMTAAEFKYRHRFTVSNPNQQWKFFGAEAPQYPQEPPAARAPEPVPHGAEYPRPDGYTAPQYAAGSNLAPLPTAGARKWVGVDLDEDTNQYGQSSLVVHRVEANSPSLRGGVQEGDRITNINGAPVASKNDFRAFMGAVQVGEATTWTLDRAGMQLNVTVVIEERGS